MQNQQKINNNNDIYDECVSDSGNRHYYKNQLLHRDDDLPAVEYSNGDKHWYKDGKRHRENDLPSIEYSNGTKKWYKNGILHREDDYAVEHSNGDKAWYKNGLLHRENGPAIEYSDGNKYYYLEGIQYIKEEYYEILKEIDDLPLEIRLTHEYEWVRERAKKNGR